jgi:hypothetical protein
MARRTTSCWLYLRRVCYQIISSGFNTMKINLGVVEFHGSSEPLTIWVESGKRNSILQQSVAVLSGLTKAWKNGDLATGYRQIDEYITIKKLTKSDRPCEKL